MIGLVFAAVLAGQTGSGPVLPGLVDLPLLGESRLDPTCGGELALINPGAGLTCVANGGGDLPALQRDYAEAALERGWRYSFVVQGTVVVERSLPSGRCKSLSINPVGGTDENPDAATGLALILERDMPCVRPAAPAANP